MGAKGATSTSSSSPPPEVMAQYKKVMNIANNVAAQPLQQYTGATLAGFTPMQNQGFQNVENAQGSYQPYFNQAGNMVNNATQGYTPTAFSQGAVGQYENPYQQDVINSSLAQSNQQDSLQQQSLQGNQIAQGAFGGDRAAIQSAVLGGQQAMARNSMISGLNAQNYNQALGQFNTANQAGLQTAALNAQNNLSGAGIEGALGNYSVNNALQGANAELGAGQQQQQLAQNALNIPYQEFQQQQQYPFQTTQWLGNLSTGIGNSSGMNSTSTQPSGNTLSSIAGIGLGIAGLFKRGGGIEGMAEGGLPDFSTSIVPETGAMQVSPMQAPQAPQIQDTSAAQDQANLGMGYDILKDHMKNRQPKISADDFKSGSSGLSPTINKSMADFTNNGLDQINNDTAMHNGFLNGIKSGIQSFGTGLKGAMGFADGGVTAAPSLSAAKPGEAYYAGDSAVVAGTPTYGFKPPTNADNGQAIPTLGSTLNPVAPAADTSKKNKGINQRQFSQDISNQDFVDQFNKLYTNDLTPQFLSSLSGMKNSNSAVKPYYQEYQNAPFQWTPPAFAKGGGIMGYADGGWDLNSQMMAESSGDPNAVSSAGAMGLMQLMPGTAAHPGFGIKPIQNSSPEENMRVGKEYGQAMMKKYGDPKLALMAYNWGPGNVDKWISHGADPRAVPAETKGYVSKILGGASPSKVASAGSLSGVGAVPEPMLSKATPDDMAALTSKVPDAQQPAGTSPPVGGMMGGMANGIGSIMPGSGAPSDPTQASGILAAQPNQTIVPSAAQEQKPDTGFTAPDQKALEAELAKTAPVMDKGAALSEAGFAMAAGKSPFALQNIGAGALAGVKAYQEQKKAVADYGLKEAEIKDRALQMANEAERWRKMAETQQENADTKRMGIQAAGDMFKNPTAAENATGEELLNQLKPDFKAEVTAILNGDGDLHNVSTRQNQREKVASILHQIDPNYDETAYGQKVTAKRVFQSKNSIPILSYNTAIDHAGTIYGMVDGLNNSGFKKGNELSNWVAENASSPAVSTFKTQRQALSDEISKMLGNGATADSERERWLAILDHSQGPDALKANVKTIINLMNDKARELQQSYINDVGVATGTASDRDKQYANTFLHPHSKAVLKSMGIKPQWASLDMNDPDVKKAMSAGEAKGISHEDMIKKLNQYYGIDQ